MCVSYVQKAQPGELEGVEKGERWSRIVKVNNDLKGGKE